MREMGSKASALGRPPSSEGREEREAWRWWPGRDVKEEFRGMVRVCVGTGCGGSWLRGKDAER